VKIDQKLVSKAFQIRNDVSSTYYDNGDIQKIVQAVQNEYPFELNYTIMPKDEFEYRKRKNDPFIWKFLKEPKVMIVGEEADFMA
jgi:hypothetical protein